MNLPGVFHDGVPVADWAFELRRGKMARPSRPALTYDIFLFVAWDQEWPSSFRRDHQKQEYYLKYDLREDPMDVCVLIWMAQKAPFPIISHFAATVVVTEEEIRSALETAGEGTGA